ncbi:unnamed protein product [Closterium sp. NIES-54]
MKHVTSALGQQSEVKGMGNAMFKGADGKMVGLKNVLWVPNLAANLISVRRLQKAGMDTSSKGAKTYTTRLGEWILWDLHKDRDVYNEMWQIPVVPLPKERQVAASISTKGEAVGSGDGANGRAKDMKSKKCNLGGTSKLGEHKEGGAGAQKQLKGEENPKAATDSPKFTRYPFSSSEATAKAPLDEVVMDVVGPLKLGATGADYTLTIVDVYTRMTWVYVLSKKSDVAERMKTDWLLMVERQQDRLVKEIRTDQRGEFLSKDFSLWLKKNGIRHSLTMPYSPAMNGITERANCTITETARGLLIEAGLLGYFWPDAQRHENLRVPAAEEEGRGKRRIQAPNRLTYEALGKPANSALAGAAMMVGDDEESEYEEFAFAFFSPVEMPGEPATLNEALESSDAEEWTKAMVSQLKNIEENGTRELVELPEGRKAIMSKWLFKIKSYADSKIERYKSRLVAKGYQEKEKVE